MSKTYYTLLWKPVSNAAGQPLVADYTPRYRSIAGVHTPYFTDDRMRIERNRIDVIEFERKENKRDIDCVVAEVIPCSGKVNREDVF